MSIDLLTVEEVAALFDCSPETIELETREKRLPGLKLGRSWRYPREALLLVLNRRAAAWVGMEWPPRPPEPPCEPARSGPTRREIVLQRTPAWADMEAIRAIYERARELSLLTGEKHHVDHEIPLQGRRVTGLHVESNLRVITEYENVRKGNKFEVET